MDGIPVTCPRGMGVPPMRAVYERSLNSVPHEILMIEIQTQGQDAHATKDAAY
jgi:hypothetical protein